MAWLVFGEERYVRAINTRNVGRINIVLVKEDEKEREILICVEYTNNLQEDMINIKTKANFVDLATEVLKIVPRKDHEVFFLDEIIKIAEWKTIGKM